MRSSRTERVNRELSLLDFDENAAEESVAALIRDLAAPRPLHPGAPDVRVKLVFVFDELDKMDVEKGVRPLIEGLKNLFLQQHAVFFLVTSKTLYYELLKDRAVEDAILNSYFSAIVHVPLLTFPEVRSILEDWIDRPAGGRRDLAERESRLLDRLARYLTYRSFGNPREIIRELRQMQEWSVRSERPFLTDALARTPEVAVFAAIQEAVELVSGPGDRESAGTGAAPASSGVALASERLSGDEARLEQIRRGLYILIEELLTRQTLTLEPAALDELHRNNFSLISVADVQHLAERLGGQLASLHQNLPGETFETLTPDGGAPVPLFVLETEGSSVALKATNELYRLIGRQAAMSTTPAVEPPPDRTPSQLVSEAEALAGKGGWAEWLSALGAMRQVDPSRWSAPLQAFLVRLVTSGENANPSGRLAAAELLRLRPDILYTQEEVDFSQLMRDEQDERVRSIHIAVAGAASGPEQRRRATDALLALLERDGAALRRAKVDDGSAIDAITALQRVADRDVTSELLEWIRRRDPAPDVMSVALRTLHSRATSAELAERIVTDPDLLTFFASFRPRLTAFGQRLPDSKAEAPRPAEQFFRELIRPGPLYWAERLTDLGGSADVTRPLAFLWEEGFDPGEERWARLLASKPDVTAAALWRVEDFSSRLRPALQAMLDALEASDEGAEGLSADVADAARRALEESPRPGVAPGLADLLARTANPALGPYTTAAYAGLTFPSSRGLPGGFPSAYGAEWSRSTPRWVAPSELTWRHTLALGVGALLLAVGVFVYGGDLPPGLTLDQTLRSRALSLVGAALVVLPALWGVERQTREHTERALSGVLGGGGSVSSEVFATQMPVVGIALAWAVFSGHDDWLGWAITWKGQAPLFVLNVAAIALGARGLSR